MTDMEQALTISGGIFAVMMLTQYGRRKYDLHKVLMPIGTVSAVGYFYLKGMPGQHADVVVYLVGAAIGLACGLVATLTTGVERDPGTGKVHTRCGAVRASWRSGRRWSPCASPSSTSPSTTPGSATTSARSCWTTT
ncbi:hypothetical protein OHT77_25690 [Streptomyces sp. NBC_00252]|uniref:hypothetical protein n=1 Tax=Streptomyces sp. NBC_00252 TaxID=2975691 RepID=UPI002E2D9640|nr:hypothetical protein [Streptomyces sp. NBC_00252]